MRRAGHFDAPRDSARWRAYRGLSFVFVDTETVRLAPSDIDGKAVVPCYNGSALILVELSANLDCDLTVSGAGGLAAGDTEAASKVYDIHLITQPGGGTPKLIAVDTGTGISGQMPAGYTYYSPVIWAVVNDDASDLLDFMQIGPGECTFLACDPSAENFTGVRIVEEGKQISTYAALDISAAIPAAAITASLWVIAHNTDATERDLTLSTASAGTVRRSAKWNVSSDVGILQTENLSRWPISSPADALYYKWSSTPTNGLKLFVDGFRLAWL